MLIIRSASSMTDNVTALIQYEIGHFAVSKVTKHAADCDDSFQRTKQLPLFNLLHSVNCRWQSPLVVAIDTQICQEIGFEAAFHFKPQQL